MGEMKCSMDYKYRMAATLYKHGLFQIYITVNTLHKGDNKDDDDNFLQFLRLHSN